MKPLGPLDFHFGGPGVEGPHKYQPGGYHPVHLGDVYHQRGTRWCTSLATVPILLCGSRATSNHLLRREYFGISQLFLVIASPTTNNPSAMMYSRYVSLKFAIAKLAGKVNELKIYHHLASRVGTHPVSGRVVALLDHFEVRGPNGEHDLLALQVIGPNLADMLEEDPDDVIRPGIKSLPH